MKNANVNGIIRLRINSDGDGVRSVVFVHSCPLSCVWCCNPETRFGENYKTVSTDELYDLIKRDIIYFAETGGGVTFSGGEPLLYSDFIREFCEKYGDQFSVNIETSLFSEYGNIRSLLPYVDEWFIDWKQADPTLHEQFTGVSNERILENLKRLSADAAGARITVTYPIVPGYTDQKENTAAIIRFMRDHGLARIELHPYRKHREEKYIKHDLPFAEMPVVRQETLYSIESQLSTSGIAVIHRETATERRKCDVLKDIRKRVVSRNGLNVDFCECTFHGHCVGTCPKCEEELKEMNALLAAHRKGENNAAV